MRAQRLSGTLRVYSGVAEELVAAKAHMIRAGLFKDTDVVLATHVDSMFATNHGSRRTGLISLQYVFKGETSHAARSPWSARSAVSSLATDSGGA